MGTGSAMPVVSISTESRWLPACEKEAGTGRRGGRREAAVAGVAVAVAVTTVAKKKWKQWWWWCHC
eukprot:4407982-Pleurochrysis_carterae.AAC.1